MIRGYTREAGVRNLEREIGALCRKIARRRAEGDEQPVTVTPDVVVEMLGAPKFLDEEIEERTKKPGVAIGLAWTPAGGDVLFVEATRMQGTGTLTLTGHLGDVMKESARAALSWLRGSAAGYGIDSDFFRTAEVHLHVPSGAIPKDGPSAGVTMAAALASELTGRAVRGDVAMTGEITLSGRVLPVGGVKEKVLAARRHGIREVILPRLNDRNVNEDISPDLRREMTFRFVSTIEEVLDLVADRARVRPAAGGTRGAGSRPSRSALRLTPMRMSYSPRYAPDLGAHVFPTAKYGPLHDLIVEHGLAAPEELIEPSPCRWDDLALVHGRDYLSKVREERLTIAELGHACSCRRHPAVVMVPRDGAGHDRCGAHRALRRPRPAARWWTAPRPSRFRRGLLPLQRRRRGDSCPAARRAHRPRRRRRSATSTRATAPPSSSATIPAC